MLSIQAEATWTTRTAREVHSANADGRSRRRSTVTAAGSAARDLEYKHYRAASRDGVGLTIRSLEL